MSLSTPRPSTLLLVLLAGCFPFLGGACAGTRSVVDPVVQIRSPGGQELGVTTDYGIVFLGRTAPAGDIEVVAWFGDGPSIEGSTVEPIGGGIFTAETEILLPAVPMSFVEPQPGELVAVIGRDELGQWREIVQVESDPRVYGLLLEVPGPLRGRDDQVGAGVFKYIGEDPDRLVLVGLVSGLIELETGSGTKEYVTVMGPQQLWRLVTHRRQYPRRRPFIYREDVL